VTPELQFALTFVTMIVLAAIVYIRLTRYESYLRDLQGIPELNERLASLVEGLEGLKTRRVEASLVEIQEILEAIREGLGKNARPVEIPRAPKPSLVDLVEAKLYNLGYREVSVITDLSDTNSLEPVKVVVEAKKDAATHKGHLVVHGTSVIELDLQPVFTTFP